MPHDIHCTCTGKILLAHSTGKNCNRTACDWRFTFIVIFTGPVTAVDHVCSGCSSCSPPPPQKKKSNNNNDNDNANGNDNANANANDNDNDNDIFFKIIIKTLLKTHRKITQVFPSAKIC